MSSATAMRQLWYGTMAITFATAIAACGGGKSSDGAPTIVGIAPSSSFARMQSQVFEKSCGFSACHAVGNSSGSGLVLAGPDVYAKLVNVAPSNANARTDRLWLVRPGKPDSSFLWHKLNGWLSGHHTRDYGSAMPLAGQSLSVEQLDYVRQWIEKGALPTGDDINPQLLVGTTRPENAPYTSLAPPANGFQLVLSPFNVQSSFERELFVYRAIGNTQDIYVNRIATKMRQGSHHFLLYTFQSNTPSLVLPSKDQVRDIRDPNGTYNFLNLVPMEYHVFFAGTQSPTSDYTFPAGIALKLPAGTSLDLNSHYVNSSQQEIVGQAEANLYTIPASQVTTVANTLNLANTDLTIPAGRDTTITKTFKFTKTTNVIGLTSHMHARGQKFVIKISGGARDGEIVYTSTTWDHPPILTFDTPIVLKSGEGLTSIVTYKADPSKTVRFGLTSQDEMDIIFGYWY
jgi:hypothetical protein